MAWVLLLLMLFPFVNGKSLDIARLCTVESGVCVLPNLEPPQVVTVKRIIPLRSLVLVNWMEANTLVIGCDQPQLQEIIFINPVNCNHLIALCKSPIHFLDRNGNVLCEEMVSNSDTPPPSSSKGRFPSSKTTQSFQPYTTTTNPERSSISISMPEKSSSTLQFETHASRTTPEQENTSYSFAWQIIFIPIGIRLLEIISQKIEEIIFMLRARLWAYYRQEERNLGRARYNLRPRH